MLVVEKLLQRQVEASQRQVEDSQQQHESAAKVTAILQRVLDRLPERLRSSSSDRDSPPKATSVESTISHSSSVHQAGGV